MADDRTERATPKRRTTAAEEGQVLRSRDLVAAVTLLCVIVMLAYNPSVWIGRWQAYFSRVLESSIQPDRSDQTQLFAWTTLAVAQWLDRSLPWPCLPPSPALWCKAASTSPPKRSSLNSLA